jgi:hypothetical protein
VDHTERPLCLIFRLIRLSSNISFSRGFHWVLPFPSVKLQMLKSLRNARKTPVNSNGGKLLIRDIPRYSNRSNPSKLHFPSRELES